MEEKGKCLLLTICSIESLDIIKVAIKLDKKIEDYTNFRSIDIHREYAEVMKEYGLGHGMCIVDVQEIDGVVDYSTRDNTTKEKGLHVNE